MVDLAHRQHHQDREDREDRKNGDDGLRLYRSLTARNRLITILRIGLPALGLVVVLGIATQLSLAGLLAQFGISGITIDRNNLVVTAPTYSGTSADGTRYTVTAQNARTALDDHDIIMLETAEMRLVKPDALDLTARADAATLRASTQSLFIPGITRLSGADGLHGTAIALIADFRARSMRTTGAIDLTFAGGARLVARSMTYDDKTELFTFAGATLTVPETPGEAP